MPEHAETLGQWLSPLDLGLPAKFSQWRPHQAEAVFWAAACTPRVAIEVAPTGFGKSPSYVATCLLRGGRSAILTSTKGLMQQLMNDFASIGAAEIKGRNSYRCVFSGGALSCDEGPCAAGMKCDYRKSCEYYQAVERARRADLVITNYAYWLAMNEYARTEEGQGGLGKFDNLVCDEGHDADAHVASFLTIEFNRRDDWLYPLLPTFPDKLTMQDWIRWVKQNNDKLAMEIQTLTEYAKGGSTQVMKRLSKMRKIWQSFKFLAEVKPENMVVDVLPQAIMFAPKWVAQWGQKYLFRDVPHVILTSASICQKTADMLGLAKEDTELFEAPHLFPVEHRYLYHIPTTRVNFRMTEDDKQFWLKRIDQIIRDRQDRKGIIHTVSYDRAEFVLTQSFYRGIMMSHKSKDTMEKVRMFKASAPPKILVSPSMTTGWDFPGAECEYQIIGKLAYPDTRSKLVKARMDADDDYAPYVAMQQLIQACGRGVRSLTDRCENFIIDDNIKWFMRRYAKFAPKWFSEAFISRVTAPEPPAVLEREEETDNSEEHLWEVERNA